MPKSGILNAKILTFKCQHSSCLKQKQIAILKFQNVFMKLAPDLCRKSYPVSTLKLKCLEAEFKFISNVLKTEN